MSKHLSPETIERLETHHLKGERYAEALLHLNSCAKCRQMLTIPSKDELLKKIFEDEEKDKNDSDKSKKATKVNQRSYLERIKKLLKAKDK